MDDLQQQKVDLLFCSKPQDDLKLTAVPVQKQELVVIVPQNHPLAVNTGVRLADTASYPHIYFTQTSGIRSVIDDMFLRENAVPNIVTETEEDEVIAGLVAEGFGIAVVPYMDLLTEITGKNSFNLHHRPMNGIFTLSMTIPCICRRPWKISIVL